MKLLIYIWAITLALFSNITDAMAEPIRLSVSPESCLAVSGTCSTTLIVHWDIKYPIETCIKMSDRKNLRCFKANQQQAQIDVEASRPITIELLNKNTNTVLATSTLNVLVKEHKKRRRQRHVWSVII